MEKNIDYITLMDIAKINLSDKINYRMKEYKKSNNLDLKREIIYLLNDRKEIFLFNKKIIEKYL